MNVQAYYPNSANSHFADLNFFNSNDNSPESIFTNITTPDKSPGSSIRINGPPLLPKIRCQDQITEPSAGPVRPHRQPPASVAHGPSSLYTYALQRPMLSRRSTSPPEAYDPASATSSYSCSSAPVSALSTSSALASAVNAAAPAYSLGTSPSPANSAFGSALNSPVAMTNPGLAHSRRTSLAHVRALSASAVPQRTHNRSGSASSVDEAAIWRHGYPTQYRQIPQYVTAAPVAAPQPAPTAAPMMQHSYSAESSFVPADDSGIALGPEFDFSFPQETTSIISYLSEPNTSPLPVRRIVSDQKRNKDWFWWDVRNLRSWSDFTIDAVMNVPQFPALLHVPIDLTRLPHPQRTSQVPETEYNLRKIYADFFAVKVNAALEKTQGQRHLFMEAINSATTHVTPKPDFISNYTDDIAFKTLHGDRRGRVVGLVKAYEQWNTGMRSGTPPQQVYYLRGLAHLHRVMREHGCRYGFIMTEVELLCVRAGAKDSEYKPKANEGNTLDDGPVPVFGFLETATPISLRTSGSDPETNAPRLTAALALWYLHMLAKEDPLPGQSPWKMAVSGVAAYTRRICDQRDGWMPKVAQHEMREAKRIRGWVWPEDPINRKEYPNKKRRGGVA
jgi:hypothetical protein